MSMTIDELLRELALLTTKRRGRYVFVEVFTDNSGHICYNDNQNDRVYIAEFNSKDEISDALSQAKRRIT